MRFVENSGRVGFLQDGDLICLASKFLEITSFFMRISALVSYRRLLKFKARNFIILQTVCGGIVIPIIIIPVPEICSNMRYLRSWYSVLLKRLSVGDFYILHSDWPRIFFF